MFFVGRYDLSLTQLIDTHYSSKTKRPLSENEKNILRCKEKIEDRVKPVLANILGENFVINSFGAVISHPGTSAQDWHVDSCHLFSKSEGSLPVLPCHFVSVFLPLYSFDEVIGPTEMALGTQHHTHCLENGTVEDQYPEASVVSQLLGKEGVSCITVDADPGDIGKWYFLFVAAAFIVTYVDSDNGRSRVTPRQNESIGRCSHVDVFVIL